MTAGTMPVLVFLLLGVVMLGVVATPCLAQDEKSGEAAEKKAEKSLLKTQQEIAAKFKLFEEKLIQMAGIIESTDPKLAENLRNVIEASKNRYLDSRFKELAELLQDQKYDKAMQANKELHKDLHSLLQLLAQLGDFNDLKKEYSDVLKLLGQVNKLHIAQVSLQKQTENSQNPQGLANRQGKLAKKTDDLKNKMQGKPGEGKPGEGKSGKGKSGKGKSGKGKSGKGKSGKGKSGEGKSGEGKSGEGKSGEGKSGEGKSGEGKSGKGKSEKKQLHSTKSIEKRLEEAAKKMKDAQKKLEDAQKKGAGKDQEDAKRELEKAKKELEEILRQLREEIQEKTLLALESRIQDMIIRQTGVLEDTKKLDQIETKDRDRQYKIEAGRLGTREAAIVGIADQTMLLFREDGTVVAMPEALSQAQEDMQNVVKLLNQAKIDALTIQIESDVIETLKEMLDAIKKELQKLQERKESPPGSGQQTAGDQPLVDKLAELKMLLTMEKGIKRHTGQLEILAKDASVKKTDLQQRHRDLARRQERIYEITQAIASEMNK